MKHHICKHLRFIKITLGFCSKILLNNHNTLFQIIEKKNQKNKTNFPPQEKNGGRGGGGEGK